MNKKKSKIIYIGWDIGGANTKISIIKPNSSSSHIFQCHLWESLKQLKELINYIHKEYKKDFNIFNIITMSGEMCDNFLSRSKGVREILNLFKKSIGNNYVFSSADPFFLKLGKITNIPRIQSMNWLATAIFLEKKIKNAIAIDIGSTTTDIIIIKDGKYRNEDFDDFSRLSSSELMYTGVLRTPIHALSKRISINNIIYNIIPENFANMSDVYRILSAIDSKKNYSETCDYRTKTYKNSLRRLSRVLGFDYLPTHERELKSISEKLKTIQIDMISEKIFLFLEKYFTRRDSVNFIGAGVGKFLIEEICRINSFPYKDFNIFCKKNKSKLFLPSDIAPAYSINMLFKDSYERN